MSVEIERADLPRFDSRQRHERGEGPAYWFEERQVVFGEDGTPPQDIGIGDDKREYYFIRLLGDNLQNGKRSAEFLVVDRTRIFRFSIVPDYEGAKEEAENLMRGWGYKVIETQGPRVFAYTTYEDPWGRNGEY